MDMDEGNGTVSPAAVAMEVSNGDQMPGPSGSIVSDGGSAVPIPVVIKWAGKEYHIQDVTVFITVGELKLCIQEKTGVISVRQKLLNLMYSGKPAEDSCLLTNLKLKPGYKIMMMGSLEKDIATVDLPPEERPEILNDLVFHPFDKIQLFETNEIYLGKIESRIREFNFQVLNPFRRGKKLLVLDIDYTLLDYRSAVQTGAKLARRPGLHEFLREAYKYYDIIIWSASNTCSIEKKMNWLDMANHIDYKLALYLDKLAMISVHTQKYGVVEIKPLGVIWGKFPQFSNKNTIMIDDLPLNFLMNPQNGLKIKPYKLDHLNGDKDMELFELINYLTNIAHLDDFSTLNHENWKSYTCKKPK